MCFTLLPRNSVQMFAAVSGRSALKRKMRSMSADTRRHRLAMAVDAGAQVDAQPGGLAKGSVPNDLAHDPEALSSEHDCVRHDDGKTAPPPFLAQTFTARTHDPFTCMPLSPWTNFELFSRYRLKCRYGGM